MIARAPYAEPRAPHTAPRAPRAAAAAARRPAAALGAVAAALAGFAVVTLSACGPKEPPADLAILSGRIYTVDPARPWAEAVAVRAGTFVRVGGNAEIEPLIGPATRVERLGGRLVLPGLIDGHTHFADGSLGLEQVDVGEVFALSEIQDRVRRHAADHPDRPWILGFGWQYATFPGGLPDRRDLDAVEATRPVYLYSYDGHTGWCNTAALRAAGLMERVPPIPPAQGEVVLDPKTGIPTGVLLEGAMGFVEKVLPEATREARLAALEKGLRHAAALGITGIVNMSGGAGEIELYDALEKEGRLTLRTTTAVPMPASPVALTDAAVAEIVALRDRHPGPFVRAGLVKFFIDGVIESNTAAMLAPYSNDASKSGLPRYDARQLEAMVRKVDAAGLQIAVHAIGDRGVRMALDTLEVAVRERPGRARRHRLEHIETIDAADIPRFATLGILASMEPYHAYPPITRVWAANVGPDRLPRAFAWKGLADAGARLVFGSDWPVVTLDPMAGIRNAVLRQGTDGQPEAGWVTDQRVSLEQAIVAYTINGAFASFEEDLKGSIAVGKYADLVVLSQDLFRIPPADIHRTRALLTIVGGREVHRAAEFNDAPGGN
jgi:hypothetical protein